MFFFGFEFVNSCWEEMEIIVQLKGKCKQQKNCQKIEITNLKEKMLLLMIFLKNNLIIKTLNTQFQHQIYLKFF